MKTLISMFFALIFVFSISLNAQNWNAGVKSLVFPGQAQREAGQDLKGNIYAGTIITGLITAGVAHVIMMQCEDQVSRYGAVSDRANYNLFRNRFYQAQDFRNTMLAVTAIVYAVQFVDALLIDNDNVKLQVSSNNLQLRLSL